MANNLSIYDPLFYANEALIQLHKALGMAARVHRGYDKEPQQKGSTINIRRPSTFAAQDAPSAAQAVNAGTVQVTLNQWKEVKIALTDKELSYTGEQIIAEHIAPAAYAIADAIDQALCGLYADIPWYFQNSSPMAVSDFTAARTIMFNNAAPLNDPNLIHLMLSGTQEGEALNLSAFTQWQGSGQAGADAQMRGTLGSRYGFEIFANQNTKTHTTGVSADATGALTADAALGATAISFNGVTAAGTFKRGDTFLIAGDTQRYVFTANATADGTGAVAAASITPALKAAHLTGDVVTITLLGGEQGLGFHRNAFALAMAPLSDLGNELGAKIGMVSDPVTNLSLRSRIFYVGDTSTVYVALDALYGFVTLDPNLAVRLVN